MSNTAEVKLPLSEYLNMRDKISRLEELLKKLQDGETTPLFVRHDSYYNTITVLNTTNEITKLYNEVDRLRKELNLIIGKNEALKEKKVPMFNWKANKVKDLK